MKRRKVFRIVLAAIIFLTLAFIWVNSALTGKQSTAISNFVIRILGLGKGPNVQGSVHGVRKMGHFTEFLALGAELALYGRFFLKKNRLLILSLCGVVAPFLDETIQMFNDRNPQIGDMWIDIAGFAIGAVLVWVVTLIIDAVRRSRRRARE